MATDNPGGMKYWVQGLPVPIINDTSSPTGASKYWRKGLPVVYLIPAAAGKIRAFFFGQ